MDLGFLENPNVKIDVVQNMTVDTLYQVQVLTVEINSPADDGKFIVRVHIDD
jgi:hypothetical protein